MEDLEHSPVRDLLSALADNDKQELKKTLHSSGWKIVVTLLEERYADLLAEAETSMTGEEALSRVKKSGGFREFLDMLHQISSREEQENEQ